MNLENFVREYGVYSLNLLENTIPIKQVSSVIVDFLENKYTITEFFDAYCKYFLNENAEFIKNTGLKKSVIKELIINYINNIVKEFNYRGFDLRLDYNLSFTKKDWDFKLFVGCADCYKREPQVSFLGFNFCPYCLIRDIFGEEKVIYLKYDIDDKAMDFVYVNAMCRIKLSRSDFIYKSFFQSLAKEKLLTFIKKGSY